MTQVITKQTIAIVTLSFFVIAFGIVVYILSKRLSTYDSALNNTVDATIMEIDEHKNIIKGERLKISNKCKKITKNLPHRFVQDGTCEL